jgi:cobyrinic acid a,c-diamide synthase
LIGLMVAGTASGVGKTTVTLAIIASLRSRGYTVQPFKGGPDFLDTTHHSRIAGRKARNLDTWMLSEEANHAVLQQAAAGADALVVEGMMGLFDGKEGQSDAGSSAEIARLLKLPVLLVVDCAKSARSAAAVVLGFESFDPALPLAGVVLNRVASEHHYRLLAAAIQSRCNTPILGWLPRDARITIPERHLGLHAAAESDVAIETLARFAEEHLKMDELLRLHCPVDAPAPSAAAMPEALLDAGARPRIGVASDRAFSFYYEDNLDLLRAQGAEIVPFSPITDQALPPDLDALYLGGGYPELYARQLSENRSMLEQVRAFAHAGGAIYAECGGMLYLSQQLNTIEGEAYSLAGVLPLTMEMTSRLVDFGYVTVTFSQDCLLGRKGTVVRGHSFHYSRVASSGPVKTSYDVEFSLSGKRQQEGLTLDNVLASYVHLHFRANPAVAEHLMARVRASRHTTAARA